MSAATAIFDALYGENVSWGFIFVAVAFGGGAAYLAGRAAAQAWRSRLVLVLDALLIAASIRFIHYALFDGILIAPRYYVVDLCITGVATLAGFTATRARQMARQYAFLTQHKSAPSKD